jgi:hypothetical protein
MAGITVFNKVGLTTLVKAEESIHETIIPFINERIGQKWSVEFREFQAFSNLRIFDAYIEAALMPEYLEIQNIISDRLLNEFVIVSRDVEFTGIEYVFIFHWGIVHYRYPEFNFVSDDFLANLPRDLVYAAVFD